VVISPPGRPPRPFRPARAEQRRHRARSSVQDRQVEPAEAPGVGEDVDRHDLPAGDREVEHDPRPSAFDPRQLTAYTYFRIQPQRLQAWREADEIADRELIAAGSGSSP
jgi:hypothetical protein